jgi:ABC-2 type transport system ATP-binding protein
VHAVRGISLSVEPGELVAVLGPNGAGKTTTMRMLTTLIAPTSGSAQVAGHDVVADAAKVRRAIGYVGQGNAAGHNQRARDELYSQGLMYGLDRHDARRRAAELLEALELTELSDRKVSTLSGGQRRRLDVAMGLVHAPSLLFLDEPTTGLDPHNRANLWAHVDRMRTENGMTIVLTTHYLDEADAAVSRPAHACGPPANQRVVVIDHGQIIADDTADALKAKLAGDRVVATADRDQATRLARIAGRLPGARDVQVRTRTSVAATVGSIAVDRSTVEFRVDDGTVALPELILAARAGKVGVRSAEVIRPTLDDVFLNLTGRSLRENDSTTPDVPTNATKETVA